MSTEEVYGEAMQKQFDGRSAATLAADSVSRQIIQKLDEIAKLIPQHRFFNTGEFSAPTLSGLSEIPHEWRALWR